MKAIQKTAGAVYPAVYPNSFAYKAFPSFCKRMCVITSPSDKDNYKSRNWGRQYHKSTK